MAIEILGWDGQTYAGASEIIGDAAYAGDLYAGDAYSGDAYSGDAYSGDMYSGDLYSGDAYAGDFYAGDMYSGDSYAGDMYSGDMYSGDTYAGDYVAYGDYTAYGADPDMRNLLAVTGAAPPRGRRIVSPRRAPPRPPMRARAPMRPPSRPPVRRPAQPAPSPAPRIAPVVRPQAVQVVEKPPEGLRAWAIGLDSVTPIAGGATQTVTTQPQVLFRGERLTVPNDIAGDFLILDLKIGNRSQLASGQFGLPARAYVETAIDNSLHMDTAQISQFIQMLVQNIASQPRRFVAQIKGKAVIP